MSVRELVDDTLRGIQKSQPALNAFITVTVDAARHRADHLDRLLSQGTDLGPLHGIPIAHKDCIRTKGVLTTNGSKILARYTPETDAEIVANLDRAGTVMVGKTNLHEFTYGITSINPHYGAVRNPCNPEYVAGGSSGGSAAAVAAGLLPLATGTDTGGSIRIPAAFCGCVGIKPTFRAISRRGVMPLSYTQDHVGYLTRTVEDLAIVLNVQPKHRQRLRVGIPANYFFDQVDPEVTAAVRAAANKLNAREIRVPDMEPLMEVARVTLLAEAAVTVGRHSSRRQDFGEDVWALLEQGRAISAVVYIDAQRRRRILASAFAKVWNEVDCLITPTTPFPAFPIEHPGNLRPAATRFTRPFNLLGWPAMSIPCGVSSQGLPIGVQLIAPPGRDETLLTIAQR
jgi:aspartyl-tRNA(Asn)/glutamyl-tRNA(Gln) amidotransferase subunit A